MKRSRSSVCETIKYAQKQFEATWHAWYTLVTLYSLVVGISYGMAKVHYTVSPEHFQNNIRMQKMITLKQTSINTVMVPYFLAGIMLIFPLPPLHSLIQQLTPYHPMKQSVVCHFHIVKNSAILETASHWWSLIYSTVPFNMKGRWIISTLKIFEFKSIHLKYAIRQNFLTCPISYFVRVTSPGTSPQNKIFTSSSNRNCSFKVDNELLYLKYVTQKLHLYKRKQIPVWS